MTSYYLLEKTFLQQQKRQYGLWEGSNSIICESVANEGQNIMCSYFSELHNIHTGSYEVASYIEYLEV